jgi:hypothetical protein
VLLSHKIRNYRSNDFFNHSLIKNINSYFWRHMSVSFAQIHNKIWRRGFVKCSVLYFSTWISETLNCQPLQDWCSVLALLIILLLQWSILLLPTSSWSVSAFCKFKCYYPPPALRLLHLHSHSVQILLLLVQFVRYPSSPWNLRMNKMFFRNSLNSNSLLIKLIQLSWRKLSCFQMVVLLSSV